MNKALLFIIISVLATSCKNYTDRLFISTEQPVLPVLTMKEANPVLKIEVIRKQPGNYSLQQLAFDLSGTTDIDDIESIGLYQANSKGMLDTDKPILTPVPVSENITFNTDISLETDTTLLWVSFKLKNKIELDHRFNISCTTLKTNTGYPCKHIKRITCRSCSTAA